MLRRAPGESDWPRPRFGGSGDRSNWSAPSSLIDPYLEELFRRDAARRERLMIRLTWAIFGLTVVNVAAVVVSVIG